MIIPNARKKVVIRLIARKGNAIMNHANRPVLPPPAKQKNVTTQGPKLVLSINIK